MNRIKCPSCGLVSWATAETCKRCGAKINWHHDLEDSPEWRTKMVDTDLAFGGCEQRPGRAGKRLRVLFAVLILLALPASWLVLRTSGEDRPQTFTLKDGSKRTSKVWFHSWFSSDPSVDEIFTQYLKFSGWQANPAALKSFVAKGRFEIRNENGETLVQTREDRRVFHLHWNTSNGEVEIEGEAPNKLVITQKYDEPRVWQRGTNGTKGWWRKGWPDQDTEVDPHIRLVNTVHIDDLHGNQLTDLNQGSDFINYFQLQNKYSGFYLNGKTMVGDRIAYELDSRSTSDPIEVMYFDVETGMLLKFDSFRHDSPYIPSFDGYVLPYAEPPYASETYLEDYREVNGIKIPFLIRQHVRQFWVNTTITDFKANVTIDSSVFEKPVS